MCFCLGFDVLGKLKMWSAPVFVCFLYVSMSVEGLRFSGNVDIEATLNAKELIQYWQYPFEEYNVLTDDGYILTVFRIPHGRVNDISESPKPVVFLQHGLLVDAANWYQNLPHNSLAFLLADAGYDVWLGNSRGTVWSKKHLSLSPRLNKFWAFSVSQTLSIKSQLLFGVENRRNRHDLSLGSSSSPPALLLYKLSYDHMAKYDLPAFINFALQKTGQEQVYYIAHSQGTTMAFLAFSTNPHLAAKIKLFVALAPVATIKHARTPLAKLSLLSDFQIKILFGEKDFLPKTYFGSIVASRFCSQNAFAPICSNLLFIVGGFNENNLNLDSCEGTEQLKKSYFIFQSRIDVYAAYAPAGTSVQNIIHWKQALTGGKLQAFDYGQRENQIYYNQATPPEYDVTLMNVSTAVWNGGEDWLSGPMDVDALIPKIKNLIFHEFIPEWNHLDFLFGLDAPEKVYYKILDLLKNYP
ncbi:hypothetical protein JD844_006493 [Phrynosoma platyrhinos]|uniref:Partial AB-hydrolase lipase domain-containing protein n=1 Tax=Phrynosoma platyrhinos TaxID=52577 RepID=A0ABQ7T1I0_PHRPL|nr:hypothetical protein JD844_006493 [Phrynosoma platyrhinos]